MHEIIPTLKRGSKIGRVHLSDAFSKALIPIYQRALRRKGWKKHLGDLQPGYLKAKKKISALRKAPLSWQPGKDPEFGDTRSGTLYWGPKLTGNSIKYFLKLEPFRKKSASEAAGNETQLAEDSGAGGIRNKIDIVTKMRSWAQIITTPTADTLGTTVLLHFDGSRYLFGNVSEGTQRVCIQRRIALSKVNNVFLTGTVDWGTTGGLIGMILTLADIVSHKSDDMKLKRDQTSHVDDSRLALHGAKNLTHLLATTRKFVFRKGMPVDVHEIKEGYQQDGTKTSDWMPTYTDENVKVWAMKIQADTSLPTVRKRSHDEISEDSRVEPVVSTSEQVKSKEELEFLNDQIRRGVVSHMFESDWGLDALRPMKLSEVRMPAAIFVRKQGEGIQKYDGILPGGGESVQDIDVLVRSPWPGASIEFLPSTTPSTEVISYIVKNHWQRGKFNPKQAKLLGVMPGPLFRVLTGGQSVTTEDGKTVTPDMVLGPGKQGGGFAVVDLPNGSYIDNLINREEWSSKEVMDGVGAIIWILGKGVVEDARLREFRAAHSNLSHIVSSPDVCPNQLSMEDAAAAAIRLNLLDSTRFPVPVHDNTLPYNSIDSESFISARPGLMIQLEPKIKIEPDKAIKFLEIPKVIEEADIETHRLANIARMAVNDPIYQSKLDLVQKDIPSKDAEVITLGTGSASPSKYRNVSATLLRVPGYGNYLFDCGENTLGQMKRVFGAELPQILKDLKVIWISHLHADHHLGTVSVIKAWRDETRQNEATRSNRLMVASDKSMLDWLAEYSEVEDYGYSRLNLVSMQDTNRLQKPFNELESQTYGLTSITACPVDHCRGALAVVFTFPHGLKVAFSGDCLPSTEFARIGKGATLLIHEATFDDELAGDALAKKHSTTSDALRIGKLMGARRILLTHFSQRYQKIPVMQNGEDQIAIVAFDYMRVKLGDFAKLAHFKPALSKLYEGKDE